jgi:hypothetical protein
MTPKGPTPQLIFQHKNMRRHLDHSIEQVSVLGYGFGFDLGRLCTQQWP